MYASCQDFTASLTYDDASSTCGGTYTFTDPAGNSQTRSPTQKSDCCHEAERLGTSDSASHAIFPACEVREIHAKAWDQWASACIQMDWYWGTDYPDAWGGGTTHTINNLHPQQDCCDIGIAATPQDFAACPSTRSGKSLWFPPDDGWQCNSKTYYTYEGTEHEQTNEVVHLDECCLAWINNEAALDFNSYDLKNACTRVYNEDVYTWAGASDTWHTEAPWDKCSKDLMYKTSTGTDQRTESELQSSHDGCCDAELRAGTNSQMIYSCIRATTAWTYNDSTDNCIEESTPTWPTTDGSVGVSPTVGWVAPRISDDRATAICCSEGYTRDDIDLYRACRPYKVVPTWTAAVT